MWCRWDHICTVCFCHVTLVWDRCYNEMCTKRYFLLFEVLTECQTHPRSHSRFHIDYCSMWHVLRCSSLVWNVQKWESDSSWSLDVNLRIGSSMFDTHRVRWCNSHMWRNSQIMRGINHQYQCWRRLGRVILFLKLFKHNYLQFCSGNINFGP